MNESDWFTCGDPGPMVNSPLSQKSDRMLRLFACACCRMFWGALSGWQGAVIVAERFADGLATLEELEAAGLPPSHESPGGLDYLLDPLPAGKSRPWRRRDGPPPRAPWPLGRLGLKPQDQGSGLGRQAVPDVSGQWRDGAHSADIVRRYAPGHVSP
jgi:hypothetical protein